MPSFSRISNQAIRDSRQINFGDGERKGNWYETEDTSRARIVRFNPSPPTSKYSMCLSHLNPNPPALSPSFNVSFLQDLKRLQRQMMIG